MSIKTELLSDITDRLRRGISEIIDESETSFYLDTLGVICDIKKIVKKDMSDHDKLGEIKSTIKKYEERINKHSSYLS